MQNYKSIKIEKYQNIFIEKYKTINLYRYITTIIIALTLQFTSLCGAYAKETDTQRSFAIETDDMVFGNTNADVIVFEYFAPTCSHCSVVHATIFPTIKEKYIDTGKIAYVMREFIGNKQDLDASILARCSGDTDNYIQFIELFLSKQDSWVFNSDYRKKLEAFGILGGVSKEQYAKCLENDELVNALMQNTRVAVETPDFIGTPSFFINGKLIVFKEEVTIEEIITEIEEQLQKTSLKEEV